MMLRDVPEVLEASSLRTRRKAMLTKSKLIAAATIAALGLAGPAFAQSFNRPEGTGNSLPSYYDGSGGLHVGMAPQQNQIAAHRSGQSAFASVPRAAGVKR
jgi:hypothetical protein